MPRRAGKAASRRARQRATQRATQRQRPAPSIERQETEALPPVGTPDAREAVSLDPPRRITPPPAAVGESRLSSSEVAEYHYVERDLRNIGILTAALIALLLVAWAIFQALGLTS